MLVNRLGLSWCNLCIVAVTALLRRARSLTLPLIFLLLVSTKMVTAENQNSQMYK